MMMKKWRNLSRSRLLKLSIVFLICVQFIIQLLLPFHLTQLDDENPVTERNDVTTHSVPHHPNNNPNREVLPILSSSSSSTAMTSLDSYSPFFHPVLPSSSLSLGSSPKFPITVGLVTIHPFVGETMHFLYDGIMGSKYLNLVGIVSLFGGVEGNQSTTISMSPTSAINNNNTGTVGLATIPMMKPSDAQVWIIDGQRVAKLQRPFLHDLLYPTTTTTSSSSSTTSTPSWKVLFVDFSDRFPFQLRHYDRLGIWDNNMLSHVRIAVRSIIQGRHFDTSTSRIIPGMITPNRNTVGGPMLHCPYAVRSDIVEALQHELQPTTPDDVVMTTTGGNTIGRHVVQTPSWIGTDRPWDVLHMWNISSKEGKSQLRNVVSRAVREWNGTTITIDDTVSPSQRKTISTSITEQGPRRKVGRNTVNQDYVRAMLHAKIVIVTQKDDWEDHYRLLEAMVCGPLVITDTMLAMPNGLRNSTHVIMFSTIQQLWQLVQYYLIHDKEREWIAQQGWQMAMQHHRSWHRMEELIFGKPMTRESG